MVVLLATKRAFTSRNCSPSVSCRNQLLCDLSPKDLHGSNILQQFPAVVVLLLRIGICMPGIVWRSLCRLGSRGLFFRLDQRHVDQMLAQEPHLKLISAEHFADQKVVGTVIA